MREFRRIAGQVAAVPRFITVPRRWCEQHLARERRELWTNADKRPEFTYLVHTMLVLTRRGYPVPAMPRGRQLVALHKSQTGAEVNDPGGDSPLFGAVV